MEYGTETVPEPRSVPLVAGTRVPKLSSQVPGSTVLMRNHPVVCSALGWPLPLRRAEVVAMVFAADVVALGGAALAPKGTRNASSTAIREPARESR